MAVYTEVSDGELTRFLCEYDIGSLVAFRGIAEGVENSNYSLRTTQGDFILTLYERRVDPAELPWFIGLMRHLAGRGITCPLPVPGQDGQALRRLCNRHAAITTFLPGIWPRRPQPSQCGQLGAALGQLHVAGQGYEPARPNALGPGAWAPLLARCGDADRIQPGLAADLAAATAQLTAAWPAGLPSGHIHADLFPDNVFFLEGSLSGLIDFYFACTDTLAYDIATCLNAWCFEPDFSFNATSARALLRGYDSVRTLSAAPKKTQPCRSWPPEAALRFLLTRLFDWLNTPAGRDGHAQKPARFPSPPALPPRHTGFPCLRTLMRRSTPKPSKSGPMAAASPNPGPGGWGAVLRFRGTERELTGADPATTNNRMELTAAAAALEALKRPMPRHPAYRQRICAQWRDALEHRLGAAQLAQRRGRSGRQHGFVAPRARCRQAAPGGVEMGARARGRRDERAGRCAGDAGAAGTLENARCG